MAIDWTLLLEKKTERGQPLPSSEELREFEDFSSRVLEIPVENRESTWGSSPGYGARTDALVCVNSESPHRFSHRSSRVVVKIYRGPAEVYLRFHQTYFQRLPTVAGNLFFQQSLEAGRKDGRSYAVLQYFEGLTLGQVLASERTFDISQISRLVRDFVASILIPAWHSGLRFRDWSKSNFIIDPEDNLRMIDVEQTRQSAFELLDQPADWTSRDQHEGRAIRRLKGLIAEFLLLQDGVQDRTPNRRLALSQFADEGLASAGLPTLLCQLGRHTTDQQGEDNRTAAVEGLHSFLSILRGQ